MLSRAAWLLAALVAAPGCSGDNTIYDCLPNGIYVEPRPGSTAAQIEVCLDEVCELVTPGEGGGPGYHLDEWTDGRRVDIAITVSESGSTVGTVSSELVMKPGEHDCRVIWYGWDSGILEREI